MPTGAARLVLLYDERDASMAHELERLFAVLERLGLVELWSPRRIHAGQDVEAAIAQQLSRAEVLLLLISSDFVASERAISWIQVALARRDADGARVIPVLLRPALSPPELASLSALPRNHKPISTWPDRDEALLDVLEGVRTVLEYRPTFVGHGDATLPALTATARETVTPLAIDQIFRLDGPPDITFVEPSQFPRLQVELDVMGRGLVVEGPSKVGKSTAIRKALASQQPQRAQQWLDGKLLRSPAELATILDRILRGEQAGHVIVDDVHYLDDEAMRQVAIRMKILADQERPQAKVTLVGVNPVGSSLTKALPDLGGRFRTIRMDRQHDDKIAELIIQGERAANIRFQRRDELIAEADGSFYIAQLLCYEAAVQSSIRTAQSSTHAIELGPLDVLDAIREDLRSRYHDDLRDFAAHDEAPPPRGASLALLWLLSRSRNGDVTVQEGIYKFPELRPAFDWLRASNLQRCFELRPRLKSLLYYNRSADTLSFEDPQLKFYLKKLDWMELAQNSGHRGVQFHPIDGPLFAPPSTPRRGEGGGSSAAPAPGQPAGALPAPASPPTRILHLSDLHFTSQDQSTLWYAQLAADLRQQGVERLDALVVSGDLGNISVPEEYVAARIFLEHLMGGFGLSPRQLVLVPGNHDLSWATSQEAYTLHRRSRYRGDLREGAYVAHGNDVIEVRDEEAYRLRFQHFAELYRQLKGEEYPLGYELQATLHALPERGLLFLGLNSAWEIDHHFRARAGIHTGALARALLRISERPADLLRVAVWHHPVTGAEPDHLSDAGFLEQLALAGFRVALHGHVHRSDNHLYRYDMTPGGRRIDLIAAGTFGAPVQAWTPGYPLQYNLLVLTGRTLTVETRCREALNGAWRPDARWLQGPGQDPAPRYTIDL